MAKPVKLPSGAWRVRWIDAAGQRQSGTFATEAAARAGLRRAQVEADDIRTGRVAAPKAESPLFRDFVKERWLPTYPGSVNMRDRTLREVESVVEAHLLPQLGDLRLDQIGEEAIGRFTAAISVRPAKEPDAEPIARAPKTLVNIRGVLRTILATAVKWGALAALPEMGRIKVPEREWSWLTAEDAAKVLAADTDPDVRLCILFALHTGARFGEQRAIRWGDLDWDRGIIHIRRSHPHAGTEGPTKSGKERRVPMTATLRAALKERRGLQHLQDGRVFSDLDASRLKRRLHAACRRAGVAEVRWHDLRHSFASQLVSAGVSLRQVQAWLGHSTVAMTERYAHLAPGGDSAISALDGHVVATTERATVKRASSRGKLVHATGVEPAQDS